MEESSSNGAHQHSNTATLLWGKIKSSNLLYSTASHSFFSLSPVWELASLFFIHNDDDDDDKDTCCVRQCLIEVYTTFLKEGWRDFHLIDIVGVAFLNGCERMK